MPPISTTRKADIAAPAADILNDDHPDFFGGHMKTKWKTDFKTTKYMQWTVKCLFDKVKPFNMIEKIELDLAGNEAKHGAPQMKVEGGAGDDVHGIKNIRFEGKYHYAKTAGCGKVACVYSGIPDTYLKFEADALDPTVCDATAVADRGNVTMALKAGPRPFGLEAEAVLTYDDGNRFALVKGHQKKDGLTKEFLGSYKVNDGLFAATKCKHTGAGDLKIELGFQKDLANGAKLKAKVKNGDKGSEELIAKVALQHKLTSGLGVMPAATYKFGTGRLVYGIHFFNLG